MVSRHGLRFHVHLRSCSRWLFGGGRLNHPSHNVAGPVSSRTHPLVLQDALQGQTEGNVGLQDVTHYGLGVRRYLISNPRSVDSDAVTFGSRVEAPRSYYLTEPNREDPSSPEDPVPGHLIFQQLPQVGIIEGHRSV